MSVYVDPLINYGWILGPSCHLTADTMEELYIMADKIGLKRNWLQNSKNEIPHFDLVESKRKLAIKNGAIELSMAEAGERYSNYLKQKSE